MSGAPQPSASSALRSPTRRSTSASEEAAAAVLDAVAASLVAASPVPLRLARAEEREAVFRLRGDEVVARGWRQPHELADGLECDAYDAEALQVVGIADGRLVATTRLVFPRPDRLLPTEETFGLRIEPFGQVVEGGRLVIARGHRDPRLLVGLFGVKWLELRARGYRHYCGNATPALLRRYESLGFRHEVLAPPPVYSWGELRVPARLDLTATAREVGPLRGGAQLSSPPGRR